MATEDPPVTCQMTTERVLKPFLDRLGAALAGQQSHADQTARRVERQTKYIADMRAARALFDQKREKDIARHDKRLRAAQEAISEIARRVADKMTELAQARAEAQAAENTARAERIAAKIAKLRASFARGEQRAHARAIGMSRSTAGWREFIAIERGARRKTVAAHDAGEVGIHLRLLGYTATWKGVEKLIAEEEARRADTTAREDGFHLRSLGYTLNGEKIDLLVKKRQDELADARARIAAGTFALHIRTFGFTQDRNYALERMGQAEASLEEVRRGWGNGKYSAHNNMVGYTISKGAIDDKIAAAQKDLADYIAAGTKATAHVPSLGYTTSGAKIRELRKQAKKWSVAKKYLEHFRSWQSARDGVIKKKQETIAHWQKVLARHREIWLADIKKREEEIAGRLTRALAETPCGGGSAASALVDRHNAVLERLSGSDLEAMCRREVYGDGIYVTPAGVRHGSPRDALLDALADTDLMDGTPPDTAPKTLAETMLDFKNLADWLVGWKDAGEFGVNRVALDRARIAITRLEGELQGLWELSNARGISRGAFKKQRGELIAQVTGALGDAVKANGYFFGSEFGGVIDAFEKASLKSAARRSPEIRRSLAKLNQMRAAATQLNRWHLPRMANMARDLGRVTDANLDAARAMVGTVRRGELGAAWKGMSKFERGLIVLSVAAAAAEASDLMAKGMSGEEATARAGVNLAVELAIGAVPITAAAQVVSLVIFETMARLSGDDALREVNVESAAKAMAQKVLDQFGDLGARIGESAGASEIAALDGSADRAAIERSLAEAERRIDSAEPSSAKAADLMTSRARLRALLRAKERAEKIAEAQKELGKLEALARGAHSGSTELSDLAERIARIQARLRALREHDC